MCEVCHNDEGIRVAAIPAIAMSVAYCTECLKRDAIPEFVFKFAHEMELNYSGYRTFHLGQYMSWDEWNATVAPTLPKMEYPSDYDSPDDYCDNEELAPEQVGEEAWLDFMIDPASQAATIIPYSEPDLIERWAFGYNAAKEKYGEPAPLTGDGENDENIGDN